MAEEELRKARPIDESRAARMVLATITGDGQMFGVAAEEAVTDPFRAEDHAGSLGAFFVLSRVLATSIVEAMGHDAAVDVMRKSVMNWAVQIDSDTAP
jgi:hypothetical protein